MLTEIQEKVKYILLMPIECTTQETLHVFLYNGKIFSSQKYCRGYDPDMSDFAVEFYKIIYKEKLNLKEQGIEILDEKGMLKNDKEFCGDTMNSYKTVTEKLKKNQKKNDWKNKYHCLANFWLLPMCVGHSSPRAKANKDLANYAKDKNGINDYMDQFLKDYLRRYEKYCERFPEYTKVFTSEDFGKDHFLEGSYINNGVVIDFSKTKKEMTDEVAVDIIDIMWGKIEKRADLIARKKGAELYQLFFDLGIIQLLW